MIKREEHLGLVIIDHLNVGERARIRCLERGGTLDTSRVVDWYQGYPDADDEVTIETVHTIYKGTIAKTRAALTRVK